MTVVRDDAVALVYTTDPRYLGKLRKLAASTDYVVERRGGDDWAEFAVDAANFNPLIAIRAKRPRSEAQVAAAVANGARLAAARAKAVAS